MTYDRVDLRVNIKHLRTAVLQIPHIQKDIALGKKKKKGKCFITSPGNDWGKKSNQFMNLME